MTIDAIILSKTSDLSHYGLTCRTINSLKSSEEWEGNIIVVESEEELSFKQNGFCYSECDTIFPNEKFNYNKFLNIGISNSTSDWVLICNNDLFFTKLWLKNMKNIIIKYPEILSLSPKSPSWHLHKDINDEVYIGYEVSKELCGWCLLIHRDVILKCNLFDEQFEFWYQDNDYAMTLQQFSIKHGLVGSSKVYHMVSGSHDLLNDRNLELTHQQQDKFISKWKKHF